MVYAPIWIGIALITASAFIGVVCNKATSSKFLSFSCGLAFASIMALFSGILAAEIDQIWVAYAIPSFFAWFGAQLIA